MSACGRSRTRSDPGVHEIVGQNRDADAVFNRTRHRGEIVDGDLRRARRLRVAPDVQKRIQIVEEVSRRRRAESDQMVLIEILGLTRLGSAF